MADFSRTHSLSGFFAPTRFEADITDCVVTGTIPRELDGAFYRLHGDWIYAPHDLDEASISADGYISSFRFKDGLVDYHGRYVKTDRYCQQIAARRQLYGAYRNPLTDDPSVRDPENPHRRTSANTTPVVLGGKLYATKEEGLPYEVEPNTLETVGPSDFDGTWASQTFTAHPKFDPYTGETIAFGYESKGLATNDVHVASFDRAGRIIWSLDFEAPYPTMLHDLALSEKYLIIPGGGLTTNMERLEEGKAHWGWDRKRPSYYAVIPRGGVAEDVRIFEGPEASIVHVANAWDEGDTVVMDAPIADGNTWPWFHDMDGGPFTMNLNTIRRVTFDLKSNSNRATEEVIVDRDVTSFTRIDDRFVTKRHRYIWVQYADETRPFSASLPEDVRLRPVNCYGRFDVIDGTELSWFVGPEHVLQEPVFVPRSLDAAEGDGFLLGTAHNLVELRSELVILDAATMSELGRVILPFRNAYQIHGAWGDAADLPLV